MLRSRCMPRSTSTAGATTRIPKGYTDSKKIHAYFEGEFIKANLSRSAVAAEVPPYRSCGCSIEEETRTVIATASLQRHWSGEHHSEWILWWCVKLRQRLHLQHGIGCPRTNRPCFALQAQETQPRGRRHCLVRKTRPFPSLKVARPSILLELGSGNSRIAEPLSPTKRNILPLPGSSPSQRAAIGFTP
jgi:hypothetical protein